MSQRLSLFVFVDALGWDILRRSHFMESELPVRGPVDTVLGYSSTCDPTILTGTLPREHGHFAFFAHDPEASPFKRLRFLRFIPHVLAGRARVRRWVSRLVQRWLGYTGYFSLYSVPFGTLPTLDYTEKKDLYRPGGIINGTPTLFDELEKRNIPFAISDWRKGDEANLAEMVQVLRKDRPRVAYLYLAGLDGVMHAHGPKSGRTESTLQRYESKLGALFQEARSLYGDVEIHLFSDHGMAEVRRLLDLAQTLEDLKIEAGEDYAVVYDSTMARFWFLTPEAREKVEDALDGIDGGRVLTDDELAAYGCDFPDRRYGELFFLAHPGVLICPSHMGLRPIRGMHGYAPEDPASRAAYASNVSRGALPAHLTDLLGVMMASATRESTEMEA